MADRCVHLCRSGECHAKRPHNQRKPMAIKLSIILQLIIGLGLLNVWLIRARGATAFRGGDAGSLKAEFRAYGLPDVAFYVVGFLKVTGALALIAGIWLPQLISPAAALIVALMVGALSMHVKVNDPPLKSLPAFLMLAMSAAVYFLASGA